MNVGVVFDAGPAAYAGVQIEFFRNLLAHGQMTAANNAGGSPNVLTCSPAPCVLPVVQVSNLTYGAIPASLVANPNHPNEMVLATDDGNCGSGEGFYSTRDGGSTWPAHSCIAPRDYAFGGDIGYDLNHRILA